MKIIISDVPNIFRAANNETKILDNPENINPCIGCFGCWIKTPGQCVIKDGYSNMGELLGRCNDLIFVSECVYSGFSPFVKNVMDRSISYIHPYFVIRQKEMHHKRRYGNAINFSAYFYGDVTEKEKQTALDMVAAVAVNFDAKVSGVFFRDTVGEIKNDIGIKGAVV